MAHSASTHRPSAQRSTRSASALAGSLAACLAGAVGGAVLAGGAHAQDRVLITADGLVDVVAGRLIEQPMILVEDGRVVSVGRSGRDAAPEDVDVVDLSGHVLTPGLIDMHVHLTSDPTMHGLRRLTVSSHRATITGVANAATTLKAGFTTVRNVGAGDFSDIALRDAIADGEVPGPRMFVSGPPVGITGGHCAQTSNILPPEYKDFGPRDADGPWAVRAAVRTNVKYGVDLIKTCSTGGVLSKGTQVGAPQYTVEELEAMVDEAHMHGRKVASHAHGAEGIKNALRAGVDTIEHASLIDDEGLRLAKDRGAYLSMDIYVTEYILGEGEAAGILEESLAKERIVGQTQRDNFRKAVNAGVNVVFGTDAGVYPHGDNARQLSRMVEYGMTPLQALRAATVTAAEAMDAEADLGAVAPGRYADLVAVATNPLDDISVLEDVQVVIKGGAIVHDARGATP